MIETSSRFVARSLGLLPFPPSAAAQRVRTGGDPRCWLCGGHVADEGWLRDDAFPDTFTNVNLARVPASRTVCQPCAAVSRGESWAAYAARRPELGLVTKHPISWRSYPHAVTADAHEVPSAARWRALLLDPPDPPFVFVIPTSKQKHLLFRATVAGDRDRYPAQLEEETVWIARAGFAACLADAEALLALGATREQVRTGRYHQETIRRAGLAGWRAAEEAFAPWRARQPDWVAVACLVGFRPGREAA